MNPINDIDIINGEWTPKLVLHHLRGLITSNDIRYVELFASSEKAVATAFVASEKATAAAFSASEKAIRDALAAVEKSTNAAFVAAEKAVALAEANAERWREDAKLWRATVTQRESELATKSEVSSIKERMDRGEGSGRGMRELIGWIFGGIMALVAIGGFIYEITKHGQS
jgi:hypothetical protein